MNPTVREMTMLDCFAGESLTGLLINYARDLVEDAGDHTAVMRNIIDTAYALAVEAVAQREDWHDALEVRLGNQGRAADLVTALREKAGSLIPTPSPPSASP